MTQLNRRKALALMGGTVAASGLAAPALAMNKKIKVGALRFTSAFGQLIAQERGYFADAGLEVELKFFQAAQPMAVAIASGDIDYAVTAISGGLINLAQKGAIKVIGGALSEEKGIDGQKILASNAAFHAAGLTAPAEARRQAVRRDPGGLVLPLHGLEDRRRRGRFACQLQAAAEGRRDHRRAEVGQVDAWSIVPHIAKPLAAAARSWHHRPTSPTTCQNYQVTTVFTSAKNAADERSLTESFLKALHRRGRRLCNAAMVDRTAG